MKKVIFSVLVSLTFAQASHPSAEGWRGIVPLRTTCADVKKALKVEKCVAPMSEYNVTGFRVVVFFRVVSAVMTRQVGVSPLAPLPA